MRRITLIAASIVSVLVIGYGGWLSSASSTEPGGGSDGTIQTDQDDGNGRGGKPGEAPKP